MHRFFLIWTILTTFHVYMFAHVGQDKSRRTESKCIHVTEKTIKTIQQEAPYSDWVKLIYYVTDPSQPVDLVCNIANSDINIFDIKNVAGMAKLESGTSSAVGEPLPFTPTYQYVFSETGKHMISLKFADKTTIPESAFAKCKTLICATIPSSVTSIGKGAFSRCSELTEISISNSVTSIGDYAFVECERLTDVNIPNSVTSIGDWAFAFCTGVKTINIPNTVKIIGWGTFCGCTELTSVNIPKSVNEIKELAFNECSNLKKIIIPESVTNIGIAAFQKCTGLTEVLIPNSVEIIENDVFKDCTELTEVNIPNSVTFIGLSAFNGCTNLSIIKSNATKAPVLDDNVFNNIKSSGTLIVPRGCKDSYLSWMKYLPGWTCIEEIE